MRVAPGNAVFFAKAHNLNGSQGRLLGCGSGKLQEMAAERARADHKDPKNAAAVFSGPWEAFS